MKIIRSLIGYTIAGIIVMSVWSGFGAYGIFGGYLAALIIIGPLWFMNHYLNLTGNVDSHAFVDMGLAIGVAGIARDTFMNGAEAFVGSIPTMGLVIVGAVIGGVAAAAVEKSLAKETELELEASESELTVKDFIHISED